MLKICFINPTRGQRPVYMVAKKLADRGHRAVVIQPSGGVRRYPRWDNVEVIELPCRYVPEVRFTLPPLSLLYRVLRRLVHDEGFDLIHAYDFHYLTAVPPVLLKMRTGVPITLTSNALVGVSWFYGRLAIDLACRLYAQTIGRLLLRSYDHLVLIHKDLACHLERFQHSHAPVTVIPNGIDFERFEVVNRSKREQLGIGKQERVLLFVGRLVAVKRFEMVLEVMSYLRGRGLPARLIVVGGGSLQSRFQEMAVPLGGMVTFVGEVPADEVREYYAAADVLVLPSRSEGLPAVVMEAAACGVPTVASRVGGLAELVRHGETGLLFDADDPAEFARQTEFLVVNRDQADEMGQRAAEHIRQNFSWDAIADQYESLFLEVLAEAGRHGEATIVSP